MSGPGGREPDGDALARTLDAITVVLACLCGAGLAVLVVYHGLLR